MGYLFAVGVHATYFGPRNSLPPSSRTARGLRGSRDPSWEVGCWHPAPPPALLCRRGCTAPCAETADPPDSAFISKSLEKGELQGHHSWKYGLSEYKHPSPSCKPAAPGCQRPWGEVSAFIVSEGCADSSSHVGKRPSL